MTMVDRLAVGLFRIVAVLHAAMTVVQAVGGTLLLVATVQVPLAVLAWRPGRLPAWPIGVSAALVVAEVAQVALGATGVLAVHVPLGVAIVGTAVTLAVWVVRARPRSMIAPGALATR